MKKSRQLTLFGLPTLLTVFIIVMVISFATLSYVSAHSVQKTLERSLTVLSETYTLQSEAEAELSRTENALESLSSKLEDGSPMDRIYAEYAQKHPELTYNEEERSYALTLRSTNQRLDLVWGLNPLRQKPLLTRLRVQLTMENDQDYSHTGDPVFGG